MNDVSKFKLSMILSIILVLFSTVTCVLSQAPTPPLKIGLSISAAPHVGQQAVLTATLESEVYVPEAKLTISLPQEFIVLSGDIVWRGELTRGAQVQLIVTIKAVKAGDFVVEASAEARSPTAWFIASNKLRIVVSEDRTLSSFMFEIVVAGVMLSILTAILYRWRAHKTSLKTGFSSAPISSSHTARAIIRVSNQLIWYLSNMYLPNPP